jgi:ethanolamine ammonia-lyase small subunit
VGAPPTPASRALDELLLARTPARVLVGAVGSSYRTETQLALRGDHAAARDAVRRELELHADLGTELTERWQLFLVSSACRDKDEYLMRPDLGRRLADAARERVRAECGARADVQVVIGDGLSVAAVAAQVPAVLDALGEAVVQRGWSFGRPFAVRYCRVGVMNDIGALLEPQVLVLLIGERPGLRTAESLSAYLAYRPRPGHTDAERNLVCNIHARGVDPRTAVARVVALAEQMRAARTSGVAVKESLEPTPRALPR